MKLSFWCMKSLSPFELFDDLISCFIVLYLQFKSQTFAMFFWIELTEYLTFTINVKVFSVMRVMMKYSNAEDTTNFHTLKRNEFLFSGMNLSTGLAVMQNSMHCFCGGKVRGQGSLEYVLS